MSGIRASDSRLAGSHFILGTDSDYPSREFIDFFRSSAVGGVILFEENCASVEQARDIVRCLSSSAKLPLMVAVDQEGGPVRRFKDDFPDLDSPRSYVIRQDRQGYSDDCAETARALRKTGVNINLAPVVDLLHPETVPVLQGRCFDSDPEVAAEYGKIALDAHRSEGLSCCAKHFPGLGSARNDPHLEVSLSGRSLQEFLSADLIPFQALIREGIDLVMTTHLLVPDADPGNIATFSRFWIEDILRRRLGFTGLVITDDLSMGAVADCDSDPDAALRALHAGHDLVIVKGDFKRQQVYLERVRRAYADGKMAVDGQTSLLGPVLEFRRRLCSQ